MANPASTPAKPAAAAEAPAKKTPPQPPRGFFASVREWTDAIVFALVLAMFIRTFVVELFKIPSGSMTPTLVGDRVAEWDYNGDKIDDLLVFKSSNAYQLFLGKEGGGYDYQGGVTLSGENLKKTQSMLFLRYDRILVNKFIYWFHSPHRGDLIVFKVPRNIWQPDKPIYIKRAAAFGGETASIVEENPGADLPNGRLYIDGKAVEHPGIYAEKLRYQSFIHPDFGMPKPEENRWDPLNPALRYSSGWTYVETKVPEGHILPLGDNTEHSSDGRYWGTVPYANLKGQAFFRFWPARHMGFLK